MKKKMMLILVFLILILLCINTTGSFAQSTPKKGGIINIGINTDVEGVDPHAKSSYNDASIFTHMFESLVGCGEKLEVVPVLAERWEVSPDRRAYTFYLRKGKLFHNGREMVAEDVKYSIERIMDPKTKCPRRSQLNNIERVEVVNRYTVRFYMKEPDVTLPENLSNLSVLMAVVPREEVEKQGGVITHPVGTGPYKFVEWKPDRYLLLERFDKYKPQPGPINGLGGERVAYLDKIKCIPIPEPSVSTMAILSREIDFLNFVPSEDAEKFEKEYSKRGITTSILPGMNLRILHIGCDKPVTSNEKFRKACAYAIDREMVLKAGMRGYGMLNSSMIPTSSRYFTSVHEKWYKKDVEKAKQLLAESGYKGEEVTIITSKKFPDMFNNAVAIQSELATVGVKTRIEVLDWPAFLKLYFAGNFQMASIGQSPTLDPVDSYCELRLSGALKKYPRFQEIIDEARSTPDFEARKKLFEEAHNLVYEYVPIIGSYNYGILKANWNYVKGFKPWTLGYARFWNVWLDK